MKNHNEPWTKAQLQALKQHWKKGTPLKKLVKEFGRTESALRGRAHLLGINRPQQRG